MNNNQVQEAHFLFSCQVLVRPNNQQFEVQNERKRICQQLYNGKQHDNQTQTFRQSPVL